MAISSRLQFARQHVGLSVNGTHAREEAVESKRENNLDSTAA